MISILERQEYFIRFVCAIYLFRYRAEPISSPYKFQAAFVLFHLRIYFDRLLVCVRAERTSGRIPR